MKNEARFIAECLGSYLGKPFDNSLQYIYASIDIKKCTMLIKKHNLEGLFHYLYTEGVFSQLDIPADVVVSWKHAAWKNIFENEMKDTETVKICKIFESNDIKHVYLKGASSRRFHKDECIRSSVDIDLFIDKKDYKTAKKLLKEKSYEIPKSQYMNSTSVMALSEFEAYEKEIVFLKKQDSMNFYIDLQWDFIGLGRSHIFHKLYDINQFIINNINDSILFDGYNIKTLPMEKQFFVMAFHYAFHHGFRGLKWLMDISIYFIGRKPDIEVLFKGLTPDSKKITGLVILFSYELAGISKPVDDIQKLMKVDRLLPLEYAFYKKMLFGVNGGVWNSIAHRLVKILLPYSHTDKLRVLRYILFNPESIRHRIKPGKKKKGLHNIFSLIKITAGDIKRGRRNPK